MCGKALVEILKLKLAFDYYVFAHLLQPKSQFSHPIILLLGILTTLLQRHIATILF